MTEVLKPNLDNDLKLEEPPMYAIILHNDNSTNPMIVVHVLTSHIGLAMEDAFDTMLAAHNNGYAPCGTFTKDLAETLVAEAMTCEAIKGTELSLTVEQT